MLAPTLIGRILKLYNVIACWKLCLEIKKHHGEGHESQLWEEIWKFLKIFILGYGCKGKCLRKFSGNNLHPKGGPLGFFQDFIF